LWQPVEIKMLLQRISHSGCFGSLFQFFGTHDLGEESLWDLRPSGHRIAPFLTAITPAKFRENRSSRFHLLISGRTKIPLHFAPLKALGWFLMSQLRKRKEPCGRQAGLTARFSVNRTDVHTKSCIMHSVASSTSCLHMPFWAFTASKRAFFFSKSFFFLPSIISVRTTKSQYRYDINLPKNGTLAINCKVAVSKVACLPHHVGLEK